MNQESAGDQITVGNISESQGIAIGRGSSSTVSKSPFKAALDLDELRSILLDLSDSIAAQSALDEAEISKLREAFEEIANAPESELNEQAVAGRLERVGNALKRANVAVEEGTSLWKNITRLARIVGPLVGGAKIVAGWFGVPIL